MGGKQLFAINLLFLTGNETSLKMARFLFVNVSLLLNTHKIINHVKQRKNLFFLSQVEI